MNCTKCGNPVGEGAKFCISCGNPVTTDSTPKPEPLPYVAPAMEGGNIIIPVGRKYRIFCPDCKTVVNGIKSDTTAGYPCPSCGKAYAYMGQLLIYRMGSFHPLYIARHINIDVDGLDYGFLLNHESVRIMLGPGTHTVGCFGYGLRRPMQYRIEVSPENYNFAFKFNLIYNGPFTYPGRGTSNELLPCRPEEIPYI